MIPIGKNIIVVDEQGNYYEATYPKRAKGLVKNGRARFIDENTICLACPPYNMEDNNMLENKVINQTTNIPNIELPVYEDKALTAREIFEKVAELQKQLTESSYHSLHRLDDSISSICADENEEKSEQIGEVCSVFKMRETTLIKMLELYEKMYDDLKSQSIPSEKERLVAMLLGQLDNPKVPPTTQDAIVDILATSLQDLSKNI